MVRGFAALFIVASVASPAQAAVKPLRVRSVAATTGAPTSDGRSVLGWEGPDRRVTLYFVGTRLLMGLDRPDGCDLSGLGDDATVLWGCTRPDGVTNLVQNYRTGAQSALPAPPFGGSLTADYAYYSGIGRRWAEITYAGNHYRFAAYISRIDGRTVRPRNTDPRTVVNMNSAALTRRLCSGLSRPRVPDADAGFGWQLGPVALADGRAAATTYLRPDDPAGRARVQLERCGKRPRILDRCRRPVVCTQPALNARIVAWARSDQGDRSRSRLIVRGVRSGHVRRLPVPGLEHAPLIVGGHLFVFTGAEIKEVLF